MCSHLIECFQDSAAGSYRVLACTRISAEKVGLFSPLLPLQMRSLLGKNVLFLPYSSGEKRVWKSRCSIIRIRGTWRFLWGAWAGYSGSAPCWLNTLWWRLTFKLVTADVAGLSNAPQFPNWPFCSPLAMKKVAVISKHRSQGYIMPGTTLHRAQRSAQKKRKHC